MKTTVVRSVIISLICICFVSCGEKEKKITQEYTEKEKTAIGVSDAWLQLVDAGEYDKSWDEAAAYFKTAVPKEQWQNTIEAVRKPLGNVMTRSVKSAKYSTSLPGAPDGEYVVIQYEASFENKKSAIETVTPMKDNDGKWRVSGYYIK